MCLSTCYSGDLPGSVLWLTPKCIQLGGKEPSNPGSSSSIPITRASCSQPLGSSSGCLQLATTRAVPTKCQTSLGAMGMWCGCCLCCGAGGSPEGTWGKERRQKCSKEEISSASTIRKLHNKVAALVLGCGSSLGIEYPSAFPEKSPSTGSRTSKMLVWGCLVLWRGLRGPIELWQVPDSSRSQWRCSGSVFQGAGFGHHPKFALGVHEPTKPPVM